MEVASEMNGLLWSKPHEKKEKKLVIVKFDSDPRGEGCKPRWDQSKALKIKMDDRSKRPHQATVMDEKFIA